MKVILTICFILILSIVAICQTWQCFPTNQKSYYQFNGFNGQSIDFVTQDSSIINGSQQTLYFKRKIQSPGDSNCTNSLRDFSIYSWHNPITIDSLVVKSDTVFYIDSYQIYFLPNAIVSQSWTINTFGAITFTCDSINSMTSFGVNDSVKFFHTSGAISGQIIRLSKLFGFIEYIPFDDFSNNGNLTIMKLIGANNINGQYGFQLPHFFDYFPYHTGDKLKWDFLHDGSASWTWTYHYTYYDSITQVKTFTDSLTINYDRIEVDSGNNIFYYPGQSRTFTRNYFGNLIESYPNDIGISAYTDNLAEKSLYNTSFLFPVVDSVTLDTSITRNFRWSNFNIDYSCMVIPVVDGIVEDYTFNTRQGLVIERYDGQGFNSIYTLVGAQLNGITYGNPNFNVGIENINLSKIQVWPNPTTGLLTITLPNESPITDVTITNSFGLEVSRTRYSNTSKLEMEIKGGSGLYFVRVVAGERSRVYKVLKM